MAANEVEEQDEDEIVQNIPTTKEEILEQLQITLFEKFEDYEAKGLFNDPKTLYQLANRYKLTPKRMSEYFNSWKQEKITFARAALEQQKREASERKSLYSAQIEVCPQCNKTQRDLDQRVAEWKEERVELKRALAASQEKLEKQRDEILVIKNKLSHYEVGSVDSKKLEDRLAKVDEALATEKEKRHALEMDKAVLEMKLANKDPLASQLTKMVMDKGMAEFTNPKTNQSETMQVIKQIAEAGPDFLEKGAKLVAEMRSDKTAAGNPYPAEQRKYQNQAPPPRRAGVAAPPPTPAPPGPPIVQKPAIKEQLNPLGNAFQKKYPDIPIQLIEVISDHIMQSYNKLDNNTKAKLMQRTFMIITNLRQVGVHIKNILYQKAYPVLNRAITAEEAAEIVCKERPALAAHLKEMEYEELLGLIYPLQNHPIYGKDIKFFSQKEVGEIIEKILIGVKKYKPKPQIAKAPVENKEQQTKEDPTVQKVYSAPENYDSMPAADPLERNFGEEKTRYE